MFSVGDGARLTLGQWFTKQALGGLKILAVAGALRTAYVEADEYFGGPQDDIDNVVLAYGYYTFYDNPKKVIEFTMAAAELLDDDVRPDVTPE